MAMLKGVIRISDGDYLDINIDVSGLEDSVKKAQAWLTGQVASDCSNFIPFRQGTLRESVWYPEKLQGGIIEWNTPYAHYMYEGVKYVNPNTGKSGYIGSDGMWHGWPGKKVPVMEKLNYYTKGTGDHWVDEAAEQYLQEWIAGVGKFF